MVGFIYMKKQAKWIWHSAKASLDAELVLFRKELVIESVPRVCRIRVAVDTRYTLFVNGQLVLRGPCRGNAYVQYRDTIDIGSYLRRGGNCLAVKVLHYSNDPLTARQHLGGPAALYVNAYGGLLVDEPDSDLGWETDNSWQCQKVEAYALKGANQAGYVNSFEYVDGRRYPFGWEGEEADTAGFSPATELCIGGNYLDIYGVQNLWYLEDRPIPAPFEERRTFQSIKSCDPGREQEWRRWLEGDTLYLSAHETAYVELDAADYVTGFPCLELEDGEGTEITLVYAEAYGQTVDEYTSSKYIRDDNREGRELVYTESDIYHCGSGVQRYSPVYYRTFRFMRLQIRTGDTPLMLKRFDYIRTGYPLEVQGSFCGASGMDEIWSASLRTLRSCMYETYMDCPYFEQMQYVMDTMLQMQYTYPISPDTRLVKKAMRDFYQAQLPNGLFPCYAPSKYIQLIPCFGLYWVQMVCNYYWRFGDKDTVQEYYPGVEKLIKYFWRHRDNATGLYRHEEGWDFVDWVTDWKVGVPTEEADQLNILDNLLLLYTLRESERLMRDVGRSDMAHEYAAFAGELERAILRYGYDPEDKLFFSAVGVRKKSQHAQTLAVLSGIVQGEKAVQLMRRMLKAKGIYRVSFPMLYFLLRALEKTGLYEEAQPFMEIWGHCLSLHLLTMPEEAALQHTRSDCHAWSALPLYEYASCYLGVKPEEYGRAVSIRPLAVWVSDCRGNVVTPSGVVQVHFWQDQEGCHVEAIAPRVPVLIELPDGTSKKFPNGGHIELSGSAVKMVTA